MTTKRQLRKNIREYLGRIENLQMNNEAKDTYTLLITQENDRLRERNAGLNKQLVDMAMELSNLRHVYASSEYTRKKLAVEKLELQDRLKEAIEELNYYEELANNEQLYKKAKEKTDE